MSEVNDLVLHDDAVGTEMANTNCAGAFEPELYYDEQADPALPEYGEDLVLTYRGTVNGEQDDDRPFAGNAVHVEVDATFSMLGRRICGPASLEVTRAAQDWSWLGTDDDDVDMDAPPSISRAQALAEELNIPLESAEELVDVDIVQDDQHGGYFIDLSSCEPSAVVDHLLSQHKTSQIKVLGNAIDRISPFDHLTA